MYPSENDLAEWLNSFERSYEYKKLTDRLGCVMATLMIFAMCKLGMIIFTVIKVMK
jgi:hypothetical protein